MKIVFVCTGNTCRSPMAEAVLASILKKNKVKGVTVSSAGIDPQGGSINPLTAEVLTQKGIPFKVGGRAKSIFKTKLKDCDVVICMNRAQAAMVDRDNVSSFDMLYPMQEVCDPYGRGRAAYEATYEAIKLGCELLIKDILDGTLIKKIEISRRLCGFDD